MITFLKRFAGDRRGLAALEFALIAPVMMFSLLGAITVTNGMLVNRKVTQTAATLADLVSQGVSLSATERDTIFAAVEGTLAPIDTPRLNMRITSIVADSTGKTTVDWSVSQSVEPGSPSKTRTINPASFKPYTAKTTIAAPANIVAPGGSVIFAEVEMRYDAVIGNLMSSMQSIFNVGTLDSGMTDGWTMHEQFYLKPRRTIKVIYTD